MGFNPGDTGDRVFVNGAYRVVQQITPQDVPTGSTDLSIIPVNPASALSKIRILTFHPQIGSIATAVQLKSKVGANPSVVLGPNWEFGANGGDNFVNVKGRGILPDTPVNAAVVITTGAAAATTHIMGTFCYC